MREKSNFGRDNYGLITQLCTIFFSWNNIFRGKMNSLVDASGRFKSFKGHYVRAECKDEERCGSGA